MEDYIEIATLVISLCAAISAMTPTQKDDKIIGKIMKIINVIGLNVGNAKNKK